MFLSTIYLTRFSIVINCNNKGKLLTKLYDNHNDFPFRIVNFPSTCVNVPTIQHLHIKFSYDNSYIIAELAVISPMICFAQYFLQLGFWDKFILGQDWINHYKSFMDVIMNSRVVAVYPPAWWKLICSACHNFLFPFSSILDLTFYKQLVVSRKWEDAFPTVATCPSSEFY